MTLLARTRTLTRQEWLVLLEAAALTPVAAIAVAGLPLPRAVDFVHAVSRSRRVRLSVRSGLPPLRLDRLSLLAGWSASRLGGRCLVQAIVLQAVLRRRGVRTEVVVGAAAGGHEDARRPRLQREFAAHAWVEHEGRMLLGAADAPYVALYRLTGDPVPDKVLA